jgi:hypothetical protein
MSASAILRTCAAVGIIIKRDGSNLKLNAKTPPPSELLRSIREHKAELIAFLTPPPSVATFEERAAIREESGELSRAEANQVAAQEFGYPHPKAFYSAVIHAWRAAIEAAWLPAPASDCEQIKYGKFDALKTSSLAFLHSDFATCGWDELALFAVHESSAPAERIDSYGLLPLIAWSILGLKVSDIGREHATLTTYSGATLRHPRFRANHNEAVPWWTHPQFGRKDKSEGMRVPSSARGAW